MQAHQGRLQQHATDLQVQLDRMADGSMIPREISKAIIEHEAKCNRLAPLLKDDSMYPARLVGHVAQPREIVECETSLIKGEAKTLEKKKAYLTKWATSHIEHHGKMLEAYSAMYADLLEDMDRAAFVDAEQDKMAERKIEEAREVMRERNREWEELQATRKATEKIRKSTLRHEMMRYRFVLPADCKM